MSSKRESVPVSSTPNYYLLTEIVREVHNQFLGFGLSPYKIAEVKYFVRNRVEALIASGDWLTRSVHEGRIINFSRMEVLQSENDPNALKIIPVWEYEEEK